MMKLWMISHERSQREYFMICHNKDSTKSFHVDPWSNLGLKLIKRDVAIARRIAQKKIEVTAIDILAEVGADLGFFPA